MSAAEVSDPASVRSPGCLRAACIDIGSNTVKLTIAERATDGRLIQLHDFSTTTRLGEGIAGGRLRETAIRRTLEELESCLAVCRRSAVVQIRAVATSAVRDAGNRDEFVARARSIGLHVAVISGEEEARLTYVSVRCDPIWRCAERPRVVDIGGGSTELIDPTQGQAGVSIPLGAVRLTEAYLASDPPTVRQIAAASEAARSALGGVRPVRPDSNLVGVGGTLVNMAAVKLGLAPHRSEAIHGAILTGGDVEEQIARYASVDTARRRQIVGLEPDRADVILGGALILSQVLSMLGSEDVAVSCRGLRWGVLYEELGLTA